jgi:hypothetical protein
MHPYLLDALARDRIAGFRTSAQARPARGAGVSRFQQRRESLGWLLVTVGLHVVGEGSARPIPARSC